jgi:hypothetical protein
MYGNGHRFSLHDASQSNMGNLKGVRGTLEHFEIGLISPVHVPIHLPPLTLRFERKVAAPQLLVGRGRCAGTRDMVRT